MRPWKDLATPRRVDLLIAAGLLVWGLPDVPWWWEYPGHAGSTPDVLGSLALTLAMSVPFCWRRVAPVPVLGLAVGVLTVRYALHRDLTSAFAAVLVGAYGLGAYASPVRRYARWLGWLSLAAAVVVVVTSSGAANKPFGGVLEGGSRGRRWRCWVPRSCSATRPTPGAVRPPPWSSRPTRPSAPASPGNCTTWSRTSCPPSPCRPERRGSPRGAPRSPRAGAPAPVTAGPPQVARHRRTARHRPRCWPRWSGWPGRRSPS